MRKGNLACQRCVGGRGVVASWMVLERESNFVVVFWWDVGMGKVKVKVGERRGKEGQVGAGEGLDKRRWWGGTTRVTLMQERGRTPGEHNTHLPLALATLRVGWVARPDAKAGPDRALLDGRS